MGKLVRTMAGAATLLFTVQSIAAGDALDLGIHHQWQSIRALGMGNAFTAVAKDYQVLFTNPAGLTRLETWQFNGSIGLSATPGSVEFGSELSKASTSAGTDADRTRAIIDVINENRGENHHTRLTPFSGALASTGWGLALIPLDISLDLTMNGIGTPAIDLVTVQDTTFAFGMGHDFKGLDSDRLSWGWTVKAIHRGYISTAVSPMELVGNSEPYDSSDLREGLTVDADLGVLYTPDIPEEGFYSVFRLAKPSFGAVVRNVLDYGFTTDLNFFNKVENQEPRKLGRVLDLGSVWEYPELWIFSGRGTMDIRDIGHENWSFKKGFHLGFEFDWTVASWWRGHYRVGLNQGYLTAGVSALFSWFALDVATYGRETWTDNNPKESRVVQLQLNIDI